MTKIHHPHDMISKRFLTNIAVAVDFLKTYLPKELVTRCDFTTLAVEKSSYVEENLREHLADILYSLSIDGKMGFIYILLEVQTTPLRKMPLRVLRYLTSIWKDHAESHPDTEPLPVILPLIFYTGEKPYHYSLDFLDCFADPDFAT